MTDMDLIRFVAVVIITMQAYHVFSSEGRFFFGHFPGLNPSK